MKNIELSDEQKAEQLEMLKKEGLDARIRNLIQPTCHVLDLNKLEIRIDKTDIELAERKLATILFLTSELSKTKQPQFPMVVF